MFSRIASQRAGRRPLASAMMMAAGRASGLRPPSRHIRNKRILSRRIHTTHHERTTIRAVAAMETAAAVEANETSSSSTSSSSSAMAFAVLASLLTAAGTAANRLLCEQEHSAFTPASVAREPLKNYNGDDDDGGSGDDYKMDELPCYTSKQVSRNNGQNGRPIWMSYGGVVYDVTDFVHNHPGGSEKIMLAAGTAIEPFWYLYRQHFSSDLPMRLMEHMVVGRLDEDDQQAIDDEMAVHEEEDPFGREPVRHRALRVHSDTPMNAETPGHLLTRSYLTPNSLFYIRNHHPVPYLTDKQVKDFRLVVDVSAYGKDVYGQKTKKPLRLSVDQLKALPKTEITTTMQCSGNRRSGFNAYMRTSGTPWGQGAVSTAKFGGVRLKDLLTAAGLDDPIGAQEEHFCQHVRFDALDGMMASIDIAKACSPYGDVIVAYEMNGEPLPRDHGFPLRVIVPGYAAVRNVKWVSRIELAETESEGPWQRGLNYKQLPPSVTDAKGFNLDQMPGISEMSIYSGITHMHATGAANVSPGDRVTIQASGWAFSGGGRNIVRVDVTGDEGKTWATAQLLEGADQRFGRAWAWTFWECEVPAVVQEDGTVKLASKAVDLAFNVQPESPKPTWNVRGLGNNSWYRAHIKVCDQI